MPAIRAPKRKSTVRRKRIESDIERKVRRIERETGRDVSLLRDVLRKPWMLHTEFPDGIVLDTLLGSPSAWKYSITCHHSRIYGEHRRIKLAEQSGRCAKCGIDMRGVFDCNHIIHRSKGRDDTLENLECVCSEFTSGGCDWHAREHGNAGKGFKIRIG